MIHLQPLIRPSLHTKHQNIQSQLKIQSHSFIWLICIKPYWYTIMTIYNTHIYRIKFTLFYTQTREHNSVYIHVAIFLGRGLTLR